VDVAGFERLKLSREAIREKSYNRADRDAEQT